MSSLWRPTDPSDATPITAWGEFGSIAPKGSFRTRFGNEGSGLGWTAAASATPDRLMPEAEPEADPVEQAVREAYMAGFHEGERVARESVAADDNARRALASALADVAHTGEGALAQMLAEAVTRLVAQIVGEVAVDEALLAERCTAIAACIDPDDARAVLEVHPDDLPLVQAEGVEVPLKPNAALSRGSVRLATAEGWIEDGPDVRLDRLRALMDDMEGTR